MTSTPPVSNARAPVHPLSFCLLILLGACRPNRLDESRAATASASPSRALPSAVEGLRGLSRRPDGVTLGDIIVGIGNASVTGYDDFYNVMDDHRDGDEVDVKVLREGKIEVARVTLKALR